MQRPRKLLTLAMRESLRNLLGIYADGLSEGVKGWTIICPFHEDSKPSCIVFYDTGIFSCFSCCEKASPVFGLQKLNVPQEDIDTVFGNENKPLGLELLPSLNDLVEDQVPRPNKTLGVLTSEPWNPKWTYRGIKGSLLTGTLLGERFKPSLVRLWVKGRDGNPHQEKFSRLALSYGQHQVYLRLSSEQPVRIYNSPGLSLSDPKLPPFGLDRFKLRGLAGLILVEGPYDLLRTVQNLHELGLAGQFEVVALLGVSQWEAFLNKLELRILPWVDKLPVITAFDNDDAGNSLTAKAKYVLTRRDVPNYALNYPGKDPGDLLFPDMKAALLQLGF